MTSNTVADRPEIVSDDPRIVSLFAARPLPCDYYDDSEGMDEVFAGWRASARRWLGYAASVVLTIALIYFLIVSAMVLA